MPGTRDVSDRAPGAALAVMDVPEAVRICCAACLTACLTATLAVPLGGPGTLLLLGGGSHTPRSTATRRHTAKFYHRKARYGLPRRVAQLAWQNFRRQKNGAACRGWRLRCLSHASRTGRQG
jgi:hypothetical protein